MSSATQEVEKPHAKKKAAAKPSKSKAATAKKSPKPSSRISKKHSSPANRARILQVAASEALTGAQVSKRFGISMATYFLWRKKAGRSRPSGEEPKAEGLFTDSSLTSVVRGAVESKIRDVLPEIIRNEVARALDVLLRG